MVLEVPAALAEHLRIIAEPLWRRVESRRKEAETLTPRMAHGRLSGRPPLKATKNLLAGLATCGICGGGLVVETGGYTRGRIPEYICHRHRTNGGCPNALRIPMADMNEAVLVAIEEHALTPEAIESVIALSERDDVQTQQAKLEREAKDVAKRIGRITDAISNGGEMASRMGKLRELETRQRTIEEQMRALQPIPRLAPEVISARLEEWRRLLRQSITQGRTVLQRVLRGRMTFAPRKDCQGYNFTAPTRWDKLFTGVASPRPGWMPRRPSGVTNPHDEDYGRLLERISIGAPSGGPTSGDRLRATPGWVEWPHRSDSGLCCRKTRCDCIAHTGSTRYCYPKGLWNRQ